MPQYPGIEYSVYVLVSMHDRAQLGKYMRAMKEEKGYYKRRHEHFHQMYNTVHCRNPSIYSLEMHGRLCPKVQLASDG